MTATPTATASALALPVAKASRPNVRRGRGIVTGWISTPTLLTACQSPRAGWWALVSARTSPPKRWKSGMAVFRWTVGTYSLLRTTTPPAGTDWAIERGFPASHLTVPSCTDTMVGPWEDL